MLTYQNMEIYGASEIYENGDGSVSFRRVPTPVENAMAGKHTNYVITGVEYRFVVKSGEDVKITLRTREAGQISRLYVWYGDFVADWPHYEHAFGDEFVEITIPKAPNLDKLKKLAKENHHRFSPEVVRLLVQKADPAILKVEGDIEPPKPEMLPKRTYLSYGSSITHNSITLVTSNGYPMRVSEFFGSDLRNLGFAGSARLEKEMADYIAKDCKFDFATLEMGINILKMDPEEYERRVRYMLKTVAEGHPDAKIFAIDVFWYGGDMNEENPAACFRTIVPRVVDELNLPNLIYINGLSVLPNGEWMTSGLTHPGPRAHELMADNLCRIMARYV